MTPRSSFNICRPFNTLRLANEERRRLHLNGSDQQAEHHFTPAGSRPWARQALGSAKLYRLDVRWTGVYQLGGAMMRPIERQ